MQTDLERQYVRARDRGFNHMAAVAKLSAEWAVPRYMMHKLVEHAGNDYAIGQRALAPERSESSECVACGNTHASIRTGNACPRCGTASA